MEGIEASNNVKANGAYDTKCCGYYYYLELRKRKMEAKITHAREIVVVKNTLMLNFT